MRRAAEKRETLRASSRSMPAASNSHAFRDHVDSLLRRTREEVSSTEEFRCTVVMTSGTFDLLHIEHVRHLKECRQYGGCVIVALNSDESTRRRKGRTPIVPELQRRDMLLETGLADRVVIFGEPTPELLIAAWKPAVFVVGSDYTPEQVAGRELIESYGGRVVCRTARRTVSSSEIRSRIVNG